MEIIFMSPKEQKKQTQNEDIKFTGEGKEWNLLAYSLREWRTFWGGFMSYHTFGKQEKAAMN